MKLQNERKESVYRYDLDCTSEEAERLKKIAIERFAKDDRAQLEYAILSILTDAVSELAEKDDFDEQPKKVKETKNGSKNNNRE